MHTPKSCGPKIETEQMSSSAELWGVHREDVLLARRDWPIGGRAGVRLSLERIIYPVPLHAALFFLPPEP